MKRFLSILLCFSLIFAISACTGSGSRMSIIEEASSEYEPVQSQQPDQGTTSQQPDQGTTSQQPSQGTTSQQPDQGTTSPGTNDNPTTQQTPTVSAKPNNPTVMGTFYRNVIGAALSSDDPAVKEVDAKADAMLNKIENYPDNVSVSGKTYYISTSGKSSNNGLSPNSPKNAYSSIMNSLKPGDAVLFKRGDIFRGQLTLKSGVTYGAYGSGIKPRFYGSVDGKAGKWTETSTKGVYTYDRAVAYANIIFNNGEAIGRPVQKLADITKRNLNVYYNGSKLYVYSPNGNPGKIFSSIEIVDNYCLFVSNGLKNVKLQNLCLMYTGVHCMGSLGIVDGLEVEGCVMGYCGGRDLYKGNGQVSLGNAIEFWSKARNVNIHDNYIFQSYDAALTHQGPNDTVRPDSSQLSSNDFTNIHYENNLLEYNTYDIEAFTCREIATQNKSPNGKFTYNDVYIRGNICRYTGWGWGSLDRPDKNVYTTFKYNAQGENDTNIHEKPLVIENNIFDRSRNGVLGIQTPEWNKANMILNNNLFLETTRANVFKGKTLKDDYMSEINKYFTASGNTFKTVN